MGQGGPSHTGGAGREDPATEIATEIGREDHYM